MLNQILSESFAFGIHGHCYKQAKGGSGNGAILCNFKDGSVPFLWLFPAAEGHFSVNNAS